MADPVSSFTAAPDATSAPASVPSVPAPAPSSSAPAEAASSSPASAPSSPASSAPATGAPATGAPAASAPSAPAQPSWLQQLRETGVDLGVTDERQATQAIAQLYRDMQQLRPLAPHLSAYMQHAPAFMKYLQSQQGQAGQVQPGPVQSPADPAKPWSQYWNPPEYNQSWSQLVTQDDKGNYIPAPGAPPDIVPKLLAYRQFRQEQAEKFMSNPHEYMQPTIQALARQEAERIIDERMSRQRDQQSSTSFVQENSNWLYELDPQTHAPRQTAIFNPATGQYVNSPQLSQWGNAFSGYVQQESARQQKYGYNDVEEQKRNAMAFVQRDFAVARLQALQQQPGQQPGQPQQQPPGNPANPQAGQLTPQQAANQQYLQAHNPAAGVPPAGGPTMPSPPQVTRGNLAEALRQAFKTNGITDDVLRNNN